MADTTAPLVGVLRSVLHITDEDEIDPTTTGALWVRPPDGQPINHDITLYTLDAHRLHGMLTAAAAGEPIDAIVLALDAAALDEGEDE